MEGFTLTALAVSAWSILDNLGLNPVKLANDEAGEQATNFVKDLLITKPSYKNRLATIVERLQEDYRTEYGTKASDRHFYFFQTDYLWKTALTYALFAQDPPLTPESFPVLPRLVAPTAEELTRFSARLRAAMDTDAELEKRFIEENYKAVAFRFALSASSQLDKVLAQTEQLLARPDAQTAGLIHAMLDIIERDDLASYKPITAQRQLRNVERVLNRQVPTDAAVQARLHFLLGRAHQELNESGEADRAFLRAYGLQPNQLLYAEEATRAYANQGLVEPALVAATALEQLDPLNPVAAAVRLAMSVPDEFDAALQAVPAVVVQDERFKLNALLLLLKAGTTGTDLTGRLLHQDLNPYRPAAQLTADNRRYQVNLALFVIDQVRRQVPPVMTLDEPPTLVNDANLRGAHQIVQQFTDLLQPTEKAPQLTHLYFVRGMAGWLLTGELAEYAELRRRFPMLSSEQRQRYGHQLIFTLYRAEEYEAVLETLALVDGSRTPDLSFMRHLALRHLKRPKVEVKTALAQHLNELPTIDDMTFQRALIYLEYCESPAERIQFVEEREQRHQLSPGLPTLALQAYALMADPARHDEVRALLSQIHELLLPDTAIIYRQVAATLYYELREYDTTAAILAEWPGYPRALEQGAEWLRLRNQYHRRSDSNELRADLRAWRLRYGIQEDFCLWEIQLAELLTDWERVLEVVEAATVHFADASVLVWSKLWALYKLERNETLVAELERLVQDPSGLQRPYLFRVAELATQLGRPDWVRQLLYPLACNRDDMAARGQYVLLLLGHNLPAAPLPDFNCAELDTMILYSVNGVPQRRLALTSAAVHDGLSPWTEDLLGKEKGKKYVLSHPTTKRQVTVEILEIHDLYTGLLKEILEEGKGGNQELPFTQLEFAGGELEQLHAALIEAAGAEGAARQQHNQQLFAEYENGETTFTSLTAAVFNDNGLEAYHVLTSQQWADAPGMVVPPRLLFAQVEVDAIDLFILDWTSLPLLHQLDTNLDLPPKTKFGISLHIVESLRQQLLELQRSAPVEMTAEVMGNHVRPHFYGPEVHERRVAYLTELLAWIVAHCETRIVSEKLDIVRELQFRGTDPEGHLRCLLDTAFLAAPAGTMVVSDDAALLQFSFRPGNVISTEVFLQALYPDEFESVIVPKLLDLHYLGLTLSGAVILREFIQAGGQFTGRALQCLKNLPRQAVTESGTIHDIITVLRDLYLMGSLLPAQKSRAAVTLLAACFRHATLTRHLHALIQKLLLVKFHLLPDYQRAVLTDFEQAWQVAQSAQAAVE
jgi:hypothetical protein